MKIRIGLGLGGWPFPRWHPEELASLVEQCEGLGLDSLWFSDRIVSETPSLDPIGVMAYIAAKSKMMKFGTSALVLGVRHPVPLAQQLATLDFLSQGRLLLVVGIGGHASRDVEAVGMPAQERARRADESIALMRKLWTEPNVTFAGKYYQVRGVTVHPKPWQKPGPPIWIGGRSEGALRRAGRLGDGWLVSGATPREVAQGIAAIQGYAADAGRAVPEDHYGAYLPFLFASSREEAIRQADGFVGRVRPDLPPTACAALGTPEQVRDSVRAYLAAGASKLVMRPVCRPEEFAEQVTLLAREVVAPMQTPFTAEELMERAR